MLLDASKSERECWILLHIMKGAGGKLYLIRADRA